MSKNKTLLVLGALGGAGTLLMLYATAQGIGLNADSLLYYLSAAENLLKGNGLVHGAQLQPLTQFPPMYSLIIAFFGALTGSVESAARLVNAILHGLNAFLVGLAVYRVSGQASWLAAVGAALALLSPIMLQVHSSAMSEPAFILFCLLALLCLLRYQDSRKTSFLFISAMLTSVALLTRYVGGALVLTGLVWLITMPDKPIRDRVLDCLKFGLVSAAGIGAWLLRGLVAGTNPTNRELLVHPVTKVHATQFLRTYSSFFLPSEAPNTAFGVVAVLVTLCLAALLFAIPRPAAAPPAERVRQRRSVVLFGSFSFLYLAFVVFSVSFFDANIPFSTRILAPLYAGVLVFVLGAVGHLTCEAHEAVRIGGVLPFVAAAAMYGHLVVPNVQDMHTNGVGYGSTVYQSSQLALFVRALDENTPLITNDKTILYVMAGRWGSSIPRKMDPKTQIMNESYRRWVESAVSGVTEQGGYVVYFTTRPSRAWEVSLRELREIVALQVVLRTDEGVVLAPVR